MRPSRRQRLIALGKKFGQVVAEVGATRASLLRASVVKTEPGSSIMRASRSRVFRPAWLTACRNAGIPERIPHEFRRTAVRNFERAGVPRSAAMKMTGHLTESVYRGYAIVDESMLRDGARKLAVLHQAEANAPSTRAVLPFVKVGR